MPIVSIVLPTYNGFRYIRESIESVLGQTYADWELIIVDDCSTDDTLEIIHDYERRDSRIRVFHNEVNRKLPGTLNIGFQYAAGKYLTWTSDDNRYLPDALAVMVGRLEVSGAVMVYGEMYAIDDNGRQIGESALWHGEQDLCRRNTVGACFLYRREVWDCIGNYDTELYGVEDYDYWIRVKERYGKIERIDRVLYEYRYHENSLTSTKRETVWLALIQLRKKHLDYILQDFRDRPECLTAFYYEMEEQQTMDEEIRMKIQSVLPELKNDAPGKKGKYIIFGAGNYGKLAADELKERAGFFADNDPKKVGKYVCDRRVISFQEMISAREQYDILIAVSSDKVFQLSGQLKENGVKEYCTWQTYLWEYKQHQQVEMRCNNK